MADWSLFDARGGLSPDAIAALRGAEQVAIATKDPETGVIGCWRAGHREPALVLVRGRALGSLPPAAIADARHDLWWQFLVEACRPRDIPVLAWWGTRLGVELTAAAPAAGGAGSAEQGARRAVPVVGDAAGVHARNFPLWDATLRRRPRVGERNVLTHSNPLT
jgi:hypothetical protein